MNCEAVMGRLSNSDRPFFYVGGRILHPTPPTGTPSNIFFYVNKIIIVLLAVITSHTIIPLFINFQ